MKKVLLIVSYMISIPLWSDTFTKTFYQNRAVYNKRDIAPPSQHHSKNIRERNFKTLREYRYRHVRHRNSMKRRKRHRFNFTRKRTIVNYNHCRSRWLHRYRERRANFIDMHGYYYGYFNRLGYEFQGIFYAYDRFYTYRDRVRGRGLFEHRYYKPIEDFHTL